MEGIIKQGGKIQGDDGKTYNVSNSMRKANAHQLIPGRRVRFEEQGGWVTSFTLLEPAPQPVAPTPPAHAPARSSAPVVTPKPTASVTQSAVRSNTHTGNDRFLNPYNFVRPLLRERSPGKVLGNCAPPPHDRYVSLTGRITCKVTAVTPLFISDSHHVQLNGEHRSFRFFEAQDEHGTYKPALPATSLRGMLRSIFEAATNSCFGVFGSARLNHRLDLSSGEVLWLVPARVERHKERWMLRLLTGTSKLRIGQAPEGEQYAAWVHRYWPIQPSKTLQKEQANATTKAFQKRTAPGTEIDLKGLQHGEECYALLENRKHPHPHVQFWDVLEVSKERDGFTQIPTRQQRIERGWMCLTNQNIEPKHSERFFFRAKSNNTDAGLVELPLEVRSAYEALIADYQERHQREIERRQHDHQPLDEPIGRTSIGLKDAGLSRFIYNRQERNLQGGELVYAMLNGTPEAPQVKFIVPVSVPRVAYGQSIGDLLLDQFHHCTQYDALCPACRVFGWVHEDAKDLPPNARTAYAGRVRISHGMLQYHNGTIDDPQQGIPLAILSTPKPTTTQLYLLDHNGQPNSTVNYNTSNARLRGRKLYRHHGDKPSQYTDQQGLSHNEYERATDANHDGRDDQNRTVRGVLKEGAVFTFSVDFENLASEELGALLWALELEQDMHHRLGYGKPLGFGSVKINVDQLELLRPQERYAALIQSGWHPALDRKQDWIKQFKDEMHSLYTTPFEELTNVRDMHAVLSKPALEHIHYPRRNPIPDPDGKNFEWFMQNKHQTLGVAEADAGLKPS